MADDKRYDQALALAQRGVVDVARVVGLLEAARDAGDARAAYALATWYLHGTHVKRNLRKAVRLLREAADQNVPDALYDLAVCFEQGRGVAKNPSRAAALYLKAALHGERQSLYELGRCYYHGIGVEADRNIARIWLRIAGELGIAD